MRLVILTLTLATARAAAACDAGPGPAHPWLAFTFPRSGSGWFVETLAARSGGSLRVAKRAGGEIYFKKLSPGDCASGVPSAECACSLRRAFAAGEAGFKFMLKTPSRRFDDQRGHPRLDAVAAAVCELDIPFIFLWRRNVLRRLVSYDANRLDKLSRRDGHLAHPTSAGEAAAQRSIKPRLNASGLAALIGKEVAARRAAEGAFERACGDRARGRVYAYEDLVDAAPGSAKAWARVFGHLEVPPASVAAPGANYTIIRGARPVLETVSNPQEVEAALRGTEFEWMLD